MRAPELEHCDGKNQVGWEGVACLEFEWSAALVLGVEPECDALLLEARTFLNLEQVAEAAAVFS